MFDQRKKKVRRALIILIIVAIGMFFFGFAMVPLYNVLCKQLGINGKPNAVGIVNNTKEDLSRTVTIHFVTTKNENLPAWTFKSLQTEVTVHPGENKRIVYLLQNNTDHAVTVRAIPSITPGLAAKYFKKVECFCFKEQTLKAHEKYEPHVLFFIDPALPKNIQEVTLSYTLFKALHQPAAS